MSTSTKIALATALILGTAWPVLANDSGENHQDQDRTMASGSVARINAGSAYGYAAAPIHKQRSAHEQNPSR
jgi:hypothetical protein